MSSCSNKKLNIKKRDSKRTEEESKEEEEEEEGEVGGVPVSGRRTR